MAPTDAVLNSPVLIYPLSSPTLTTKKSCFGIDNIIEIIIFFHCRFRLCIKLVLIMGLVWITEFIPLITGIYYLYAVAGMLNCLHGVYFFFIFACKKRTFKQFCSSTCFCCKNITKTGRKQSPSLDTITTLAF